MKIGFASADWSHTVKDDRGHPVWGGSGWARLGQYQKLLPFDIVVGVLAFKNGHFGVLDWNRSLHLDCDIVYMQRVMFADVPDRILGVVSSQWCMEGESPKIQSPRKYQSLQKCSWPFFDSYGINTVFG